MCVFASPWPHRRARFSTSLYLYVECFFFCFTFGHAHGARCAGADGWLLRIQFFSRRLLSIQR